MPNFDKLLGEPLAPEIRTELSTKAAEDAKRIEQDRKEFADFEAKPIYEKIGLGVQAGWEDIKGSIKTAGAAYANDPNNYMPRSGMMGSVPLPNAAANQQIIAEAKKPIVNTIRESAQQNYDKVADVSKGAHGLAFETGQMLPQVGQMVGVIAAHTFAPQVAGVADAAYMGGMAMTSGGGAMHTYEEYKKSIGEDPYDPKFDSKKQLIGLGGAVLEVGAESLLGGVTRYLPGKMQGGLVSGLMEKLIKKDGGQVVENAMRRFASEQPDLFAKAMRNLVKLGDKTAGEVLEENTTEIGNIGMEYIYREVEDKPEWQEILDRHLGATKGALMMSGMLHVPSNFSQRYVTDRMRDARGVQLASVGDEVFEVTHVEEKSVDEQGQTLAQPQYIVHGKKADGQEVSFKPEEIQDQATLTHDEFKEYVSGMQKGQDMQALEQVAQFRNQSTGRIEMALSHNQKEGEVPFYILNNHPNGTAVVMDADTGKRRMINISEINHETVQTIDEQQFLAQLRPQEAQVQPTDQAQAPDASQLAPMASQYQVGQPVQFNGMAGVVSDMSTDGRMVIETAQGSMEATADQLKPVQTLTDGKEEYVGIENPDGTLTVGDVMFDQNKAQKKADQLNQLYKDKRTFEVKATPSGDVNTPDTYQIISKENQAQATQASHVNKTLPVEMPPAPNLVNDGNGNLTPYTPDAPQQEVSTDPVYRHQGQAVSKSYLKGLIRTADSTEDLNGVEIENDDELMGMVEAKFPSPKQAYTYEGEVIDREEALGIIAGAKKPEQLAALNIENDAELLQAAQAKFAPVEATTENQTQQEPTSSDKEGKTLSFYHGGLSDDFSLESLDTNRLAEKQQKKGRNYAGFYMYDESGKEGARIYSEQTGKGLHRFDVDANARILQLGNIERVSQAQLDEYRNQGYDMIQGKDVRGRIEYVLLNKDVVKRVENEKAKPQHAGEVIENHSINRDIQQAEADVHMEPTEAQKEAGNYKKGHITLQGLDITIENPQGSQRSGTDAKGKPWQVTMNNTYGYFKRTQGKDGDQVDVFIGNKPTSQRVFVIDQVNQDGTFDEHKVMMGFESKQEAADNYNQNYSAEWTGLGNITEMGMDEFKGWLKDGKRTKQPAATPLMSKEAIEATPELNGVVRTPRKAVFTPESRRGQLARTEPLSLRHAILNYFINDGKVTSQLFRKEVSNKPGEYAPRLGLFNNTEGIGSEDIMQERMKGQTPFVDVDGQTFRDELHSVLRDHKSVGSMMEEAERLIGSVSGQQELSRDEQRAIEERMWMEQQQREEKNLSSQKEMPYIESQNTINQNQANEQANSGSQNRVGQNTQPSIQTGAGRDAGLDGSVSRSGVATDQTAESTSDIRTGNDGQLREDVRTAGEYLEGRFSRRDTEQRTRDVVGHKALIEKTVSEFNEKVQNASKTVVVERQSDLADAMQGEKNKIREQVLNETGTIGAYYSPDTDTIYMVAENMPESREGIFEVYAHEQLLHKGLRMLIPNRAQRQIFMKQIFDVVGNDAIMETIGNSYALAPDAVKAEEYLAKIAEKLMQEQDLTQQEQSTWDNFIKRINDLILQVFGRKVNLTTEDLHSLIRASAQEIIGYVEQNHNSERSADSMESVSGHHGRNLEETWTDGIGNGRGLQSASQSMSDLLQAAIEESIELIPVSHSTAASFDHFDDKYFGGATNDKVLGEGHYTGDDWNDIKQYAGKAAAKAGLFDDYAEGIRQELGAVAAEEFINIMKAKGLPEKVKSPFAPELFDYVQTHPLPKSRIRLDVLAFKNNRDGQFNHIHWDNKLTSSQEASIRDQAKGHPNEKEINELVDNHESGRDIIKQLGGIYEKGILTEPGIFRNEEEARIFLSNAGFDGVISPRSKNGKDKGNYITFFDRDQLAIDEVGYFKLNEQEKKLVALHNIDETTLERALSNGGMIAPSIAITDVNNPYTDFGDITLIGNKQLIDPTNGDVKVFAGDVYSPTVPRPQFKLEKGFDKWATKIVKKAYGVHPSLHNMAGNEVSDYGRLYKDMQRETAESIVKNNINNEMLKMVYLVDQGVELTVPMREKPYSLVSGYNVNLTDAEKAHAKEMWDNHQNENDYYKSEEFRGFAAGVLERTLTEKYGDDKDTKKMFDGILDNRLGFSSWTNLSDAFSNRMEVEGDALKKTIVEKTDQEAYEKWLSAKVKEFQGEKYFTVGNKKLPYTSANLLDVIVGKTRGQESLMTFGMNKARSFYHKQFKTIDAMKKIQDILVSKDEMTQIDEAYSAEYFLVADKLSYNYSSTLDKLDDFGRSLADYYKGKSAAMALRKNNFDGTTGVEEFKDFADRLKSNPVDYFEAKMQREVELNEFQHAIVPNTTSEATINALEKKGVSVTKYETKEERHEIVKRVTEEDGLRFKKTASEDIFFSPTQRALESISMGKATSQQWKAMLMKNGAKEAEMEWSGLNELLSDGRRSFTKYELHQTLEDNKIELEEVVKEDGVQKAFDGWSDQDVREHLIDNMLADEDEVKDMNRQQMEAWANENSDVDEANNETTKYANYKTPGGQNYKEWLLTLPENKSMTNAEKEEKELLGRRMNNDINFSDVDMKRYNELERKSAERIDNNFKSSHWSEPNVAVHIRTQEFTDKDGKRVLLLDEVQSDWAQEGKKKGFTVGYKEHIVEDRTVYWVYNKEGKFGFVPKTEAKNEAEALNYSKAHPEIFINESSKEGVPDMPFKQTPQWVSLAFRRMLRHAAENGFDTVAWSTGKQNADRYSLSKQVDMVFHKQNEDGTYHIEAVQQGATRDDRNLIGSNIKESELEGAVGKELAQKIINTPETDETYGGMYAKRGTDLEVGGEGMKSFYDQIIPSVVKKAFKATPTTSDLVIGEAVYAEAGDQVIDLRTGEMEPNTGQNTESQTVAVHSIDLTPELKEKSLQPQPLFKKRWKESGASEAMTPGEALEKLIQHDNNRPNHKAVQEKANAFVEKYGHPVVVASSTRALPSHIQAKIKRGEERQIQGLIDTKTGIIYLVSNNVNPKMAEKVMMHELIGHKGLRDTLGEQFNPVLKKIYDSMSETERRNFADIYGTNDAHLIAEEYVAHLAENYKRPDMLRSALAKIREYFRNVLGLDYSLNDIMHMLAKAEGYYLQDRPNKTDFSSAESYLNAVVGWDAIRAKTTPQTQSEAFKQWFGKSVMVDANGKPKVVYHGTGSDFTVFDNKKAHDKEGRKAGVGFGKGKFYLTTDAQVANSWANNSVERGNWTGKKERGNDYGSGETPNVMPLYVRLENPIAEDVYFDRLQEKLGKLGDYQFGVPQNLRDKAIAELDKEVKKEGHDGILGDHAIAVFNSRQIKSATGNNGDFDPTDPDIRFSRKNHPADLSQKGDAFIEAVQDKMISVKRLEQEVANRGGNIGEFNKVARAETLSYGKVKTAIEKTSKELVDPLMRSAAQVVKAKGCTLTELQRYLKAKHAPERNRVISNRLKLNGEANQSGFETVEAEKIVDTFERGVDKAMIDQMWKDINNLSRFTLDRWLRDGFISQEHHDVVSKMYQHYVPMKGYMDKDTTWEYMSQSFGSVVNPNQDAEGRQLESEDPIQNLVSMAQTAIIAGEKNRVSQHAYRLATNNKEMEDLFKAQKVWYVETDQQDAQGHFIIRETYEKPEQALFDAGKVTEKVNPKTQRIGVTATQEKEHEVEVFINGQKHKVVFENPSVARALNGENVVQYEFPGFQQIASATRWLSANLTAKNPAFIPINTMRDLAYATTAHYVKGSKGDTGRFVKNLAKAEMAMRDNQKGKGGKYVDMYNQFRENGGETGFIHSKDTDELMKEVERDVKRYSGTNSALDKTAQAALTYSSLRFWGQKMENFAIRSENLSRFATYLTAIERGATPEQAALEAKEITVNFNTKGTHAKGLGGLFAFFNASVQGGQNFMKMGWQHKGKFAQASGMFMGMGFLTAMAQMMTDDDEEEEKQWDNLSDYMKQNYLCIGYAKGKYVSIPLPPGFRAFYAMGVMAADQTWGVKKSAPQLALNLGSVMTGAVSPIDPIGLIKESKKGTYQADPRPIIPTVALPIYDILKNEDFSGRPITREPYTRTQQDQMSDAGMYMKNVNGLAKWMTDKVYEMGGGDTELYTRDVVSDGEMRPVSDLFDYNPSNIEHLIESYTGGRGKFFNQLQKTTFGIIEAGYKAVKGEEEPLADIESNDIPILSRLNRRSYGVNYLKLYYQLESEVESYKQLKKKYELKGEQKTDNEMERKQIVLEMLKKDMKEIEFLTNESLANPDMTKRNREMKAQILKPYLKYIK